MIQPLELLQHLQKRPYQPFAVHLKDGRVLELRYPDHHIVGTTFFCIGIPEVGYADPLADHWETVSLTEILRVEVLPPAPVQTPG